MKYIVFTTKHHDGFCMCDTKQTDYNIMNSPFRSRRGQGTGRRLPPSRASPSAPTTRSATGIIPISRTAAPAATSLKPTSQSGRVTNSISATRSRELIPQYGPLLILWFDVPQDFDAQRGQGVVDYVRSLQPDIIINNRVRGAGRLRHAGTADRRFQSRAPVGNLHDDLHSNGRGSRTTTRNRACNVCKRSCASSAGNRSKGIPDTEKSMQ